MESDTALRGTLMCERLPVKQAERHGFSCATHPEYKFHPLSPLSASISASWSSNPPRTPKDKDTSVRLEVAVGGLEIADQVRLATVAAHKSGGR